MHMYSIFSHSHELYLSKTHTLPNSTTIHWVGGRQEWRHGCCSVAKSCSTLCNPMETAAHQASLSFTISWSLCKFMSIEPVMLSNHLILCCPLLLLPSIFPSIRVFSPVSRLFVSGRKSTGATVSVLPMNIQD